MTEEVQTERSWLKLSDGESLQFVILDDTPSIHVLHWVQGVAEEHLEVDCPWCKQGVRRAVRYTIPIKSQDGSDAWEMASLTWKDLKAVGAATGGIKGQTIALSRRGVGRATRYTIVPLGKRAPVDSPAPAETAQPSPDPSTLSDGTDAFQLAEEMKNIAADPAGAAAYIKGLCAGLEISTEVAVAKFHSANPDVGRDAGSVRILAGVSQMLEQQATEAQAQAVPDLDIALGELLGFEIEDPYGGKQ